MTVIYAESGEHFASAVNRIQKEISESITLRFNSIDITVHPCSDVRDLYQIYFLKLKYES